MGLFGFGHKQDDNLDQTQAADGQDQWSDQATGQDSTQAAPTPVSSIDGVLPVAHGNPSPRPSQPADAQQASTDITANDAGDYIMEEPKTQSAPVPAAAPEPINRVEPAYGGVPAEPQSTPEPETKSEEPVPAPPLPVASDDIVEESIPKEEPEQPAEQADAEEDLSDIKQRALMDLTPLVDRLDQTPEEKFHTIMMLLQNTDRLSLIKTAYDAALKIEDETTKAEALLDVVNEINYFNQKQEDLSRQQPEEDK